MPRALALAALLAAVTTTAGCSRGDAAAPAPAPAAATARPPVAARPRLVFFMNPNGRPCQLQDAILRSMPDLPSLADVTYLRTTEPGDLARFDQYGIRSLPQLVVTAQDGAELRRATPGIQTDAQVRQLLGP